MAKTFDGPPTREEIPILRGQIFDEHIVDDAIEASADKVISDYDGQPIIVIEINQGAVFFANGLRAAVDRKCPGFLPPHHSMRVTRTNSDSTFRKPVVTEPLPEDLSLRGFRTLVLEDIIDEGRTITEALVPHLLEHGAELDDITILALLRRLRDPAPVFPVRTQAELETDVDDFVFGSGIDDERLRVFARYRHDAGRGEKGIWGNDPIV